MKMNALRRCVVWLAPMVVLAVVAMPVLGQTDPSELRPPNPGSVKGPVPVLVYILIGVLTAMMVFAATLKAKRGHQD